MHIHHLRFYLNFHENKSVAIVSAVAGITESGGFPLMLQAAMLLLVSVMFLLSLLLLSTIAVVDVVTVTICGYMFFRVSMLNDNPLRSFMN
jgi:hypothetical protein